MQQDTKYFLPALPAGTDALSQDLHSQHFVDEEFSKGLTALLQSEHMQTAKGIKALVVGGKCGLTAEILASSCQEIDIIEQQPYFGLLQERFINKKKVDYFFGQQGEIGERFVLPEPNIGKAVVRVIEAKNFLSEALNFYDVILLQNWIVNDKVNLLRDFIKIDHNLLITMLVPGKIQDRRIFGFLSDMQKNILRVFYENIFYQRLKGKRRITGRRNQILFHQVFGWKKKKQEGDSLKNIQEALQSVLVHFQEQTVSSKQQSQGNPYETQELVDMYLNFHFGPEYLSVQNFPSACAKITIETAKKHEISGRVLDLGCAVGRTTIDLADYFDEAVGVDFSNAFIKAAIDSLPACKCRRERIKFEVGNACELDKSLGKFNLIFGGNLIDRLYDPAAFLLQIGEFLQPKGILILTSPYTWLEEYTPKAKWLGGIIENGVEIRTQKALLRALQPLGFVQLRDSQDLPFVIRENEWVYQNTRANVTFWQKKEK